MDYITGYISTLTVKALLGLQSDFNDIYYDTICAVKAALELGERFNQLQTKSIKECKTLPNKISNWFKIQN